MAEAGKLGQEVAEREARAFVRKVMSRVKQQRMFPVLNGLALTQTRQPQDTVKIGQNTG